MTPISPDDVGVAARLCRQTLEPVVNQDWTVRAGSLDWDCRQTTAHIADALGFYAAHLGSRATEWLKFDVVPHADASNLHLVRLVEAMGEVLVQVLAAAPDDARAFHHSGMRDKKTITAMGCLEVLVHTGDVADGLKVTFEPPRELCATVVASTFVGAPVDHDPWRILWWATGRGDLEGQPRLGPDWEAYWLRGSG
jgi:hypothetical protein